MTWTEMLKEQADFAYKAAHGLIELVNDDTLEWKPPTGRNWLTTGQLIRHVTNACGNTAAGFVTGKWEAGDHGISPDYNPGAGAMPTAEHYLAFNRAQALSSLTKDRAVYDDAVERAGEARLATERLAPPWGGPERLLGAHLLMCIQHLDQHKGQLFYYLKLQGQPVDTTTMWGV